MYRKVETDLNFLPREQEVLAFWKEHRVFEKSVELRRGAPAYTFYDGPPTANGKPHIGHILTRCIKDIIPRYRTMKGYDVLRKAGWDTHGLPVELEVEKQLGLDGKEQIEAYGVEPFIEACKKSVWKYKAEWEHMSDRVGFWADMDDPYITYDNDYIESEWWALKTIYDKGLLYKGYKIVPYCPRCGTALSSHEVAQGYKDVKETSAIARFYLRDEPDVAILAWTTTPWTLPSNVALCVNADETYVRARAADGRVYILAEALVPSVLGEGAEILSRFEGRALVGLSYVPLFDLPVDFGQQQGYRVVSDGYVTLTDGTGVVHIAPAFGEDDSRVGREWSLPFLQLVDARGHLCGGTPWDGLFVKDADKPILKALEESGKLFAAPSFEHSYPFCWRCDTPLIYYARESWFIRMTAVKDKLIRFNRAVNWIPETIKEGRMGNFLENVIDWGVSRERYWGTPLPVWTCACGHTHVIGSRAELKAMSRNCPDDIELHKPYIDRVEVLCPVCGKVMKRENAVLDCWFDSGSMPFAQWHYPFENKEAFERRYPADFISEAIDQTRGWFFTLHAIATMLFDSVAFRNIISNGLVLDKNGNKMSKRLGNAVDPFEVLATYGPDATRWYMISNSQPWDNLKFDRDGVDEVRRKFFGTLYNTYSFFALYANVDGFTGREEEIPVAKRPEIDRWIISLLNTLVRDVTRSLEDYDPTPAARAIQEFVGENLSNWYVRLNRKRFWGGGMSEDKLAAYQTLYTCLETVAMLAAPFAPFISDRIFTDLNAVSGRHTEESVHLSTFPEADERLIDPDLEEMMSLAQRVSSMVLALRRKVSIKVRQPLMKILIPVLDPAMAAHISAVKGLILSEVNVKQLELIEDTTGIITKRIKPNFKTLGPRYGKYMKQIAAMTAEFSQERIARIEAAPETVLDLGAERITVTPADFEITSEDMPGWLVSTEGKLTVALDITLTDELRAEGAARELINRIQNIRKESGFEVTDKIRVEIEAKPAVEQALAGFSDYIAAQTLAVEVKAASAPAGAVVVDSDLDDEPLKIAVTRI